MEMIQRYCPNCNALLTIQGKLKNLVGKEVMCSVCLSRLIVLDPYPKKQSIFTQVMDALVEAAEIEKQEKGKNDKAWLAIGGFALGAFLGLTRNRDK